MVCEVRPTLQNQGDTLRALCSSAHQLKRVSQVLQWGVRQLQPCRSQLQRVGNPVPVRRAGSQSQQRWRRPCPPQERCCARSCACTVFCQCVTEHTRQRMSVREPGNARAAATACVSVRTTAGRTVAEQVQEHCLSSALLQAPAGVQGGRPRGVKKPRVQAVAPTAQQQLAPVRVCTALAGQLCGYRGGPCVCSTGRLVS